MATQTEEVPEEPTVKPNIEKVAELIALNGPIQKAEEKGQKSRSDLGNLYKRVEDDFHAHRGATKAVRKLLTMSATQRADYMRTFEPLAEHFKLFPSQVEGDMIDQVERETESKGGALDAAKRHLEGGTRPEPMFDEDEGKGNGADIAGDEGGDDDMPPKTPGVVAQAKPKLGIVTSGGTTRQ